MQRLSHYLSGRLRPYAHSLPCLPGSGWIVYYKLYSGVPGSFCFKKVVAQTARFCSFNGYLLVLHVRCPNKCYMEIPAHSVKLIFLLNRTATRHCITLKLFCSCRCFLSDSMCCFLCSSFKRRERTPPCFHGYISGDLTVDLGCWCLHLCGDSA